MANLVASLGEQIKVHIPQNTGSITGQQDDQQPEAKKRKIESEFNLNGSLVTCAEYKGMTFDGLTYHNAVKNIMRQKIMLDEVFDLEKIYAVSEHADEYRQSSAFNLQSSNMPAKLTIKTIPEFFEALYLFGIFYLQKYPEKTASFLEYVLYMQCMTTTLWLLGLTRLDNQFRAQFVMHPDWSWARDKFIFQQILEEIKSKAENLSFRNFHMQLASKARQLQSNGFSRQRSNSVTGGSTQPRSSNESLHKRLGKTCCKYWNNGNCSRGCDCYRKHECLKCGSKDHTEKECIRQS